MDIQGRIGVVINQVGIVKHRTIIAIDTATLLSVTTGYNTVEFRPINNTVYIGDTGVTVAAGYPIYRREWRAWNNIKNDFNLYYVCSNGQTSTIHVLEYE